MFGSAETFFGDRLGASFALYPVVDGNFAAAEFLRAVDQAGLPVVARLEVDLPEFAAAVEKRFSAQPPSRVYWDCPDRVEIWDVDDFDPWETLAWPTVRVIRYRRHKPDGTVVQADWLTSLPMRQAARSWATERKSSLAQSPHGPGREAIRHARIAPLQPVSPRARPGVSQTDAHRIDRSSLPTGQAGRRS